MSFFEKIFGAQTPSQPPVNPAPGQNPNQPQNQAMTGTQATAQTAANGVVPAAAATTEPAKPVSPLDAHKDIWQTPDNANQPDNSAMFANLDPAKLMESARKVNFASTLTPEVLQKVQAGGEEGLRAFQESLNSVAQTVYGQSALATTKIVEQALSKQKEQFDANLPAMVKRLSANEGLMTSNPIMSNPAIQPLVGALQEQLVRRNPNATSAEIQQQVVDYFSALGNTFAAKPVESAAQKKASTAEDWSKFLTD